MYKGYGTGVLIDTPIGGGSRGVVIGGNFEGLEFGVVVNNSSNGRVVISNSTFRDVEQPIQSGGSGELIVEGNTCLDLPSGDQDTTLDPEKPISYDFDLMVSRIVERHYER